MHILEYQSQQKQQDSGNFHFDKLLVQEYNILPRRFHSCKDINNDELIYYMLSCQDNQCKLVGLNRILDLNLGRQNNQQILFLQKVQIYRIQSLIHVVIDLYIDSRYLFKQRLHRKSSYPLLSYKTMQKLRLFGYFCKSSEVHSLFVIYKYTRDLLFDTFIVEQQHCYLVIRDTQLNSLNFLEHILVFL